MRSRYHNGPSTTGDDGPVVGPVVSGGVAVSTSQESRWRPPPGAVQVRRRIRWLGRGEPAVVGLAAVVVAVAVWRRSPVDAGVAVLGAVALVRRWTFAVGLALLAGVATVRSVDSVASLAPDRLGAFSGWVTVASDPATSHGSTRLLLQVEGERFEVWVRGPATQAAVARWQQGDRVWVSGDRQPLRPARAARVSWEHVVGAFRYDVLGDRREGRPLAVASNRVRDLIERGSSSMPSADAALARGLII